MKYSVVKHVVERPIQYTYTVLLFSSKKTKGKRQDTESVPLLAPGTESAKPGTESATPDVYIVVEEASPVPTWHAEI